MATRKDREKRERRVVSAKRRVAEHTDSFQRTSLNVPEGVSLFSLKKEGTYRVNILPYKVGRGNPFADKGEEHYERTYFTHANVGPQQRAYVCLAETFKKPCPICEEQAKLRRKGVDGDLIKALYPKERQLFNVQDVTDSKEAAKGVQLWDISFHLFGKLLDSRVRKADDDDGYEFFADPEKGFTLKLEVEEKSIGKGKPFCNVSAIEFKARKGELDSELLEGVQCLDDMPKEVPYKELKEIFLQTGSTDDEDEDDKDDDDDDDEDEKPAKKKSKKEDVEDEEDDSEDSDEDKEDDDEGTEVPCKVGDTVAFPHPRDKKKTLRGKVKTVNVDKEIVTIDSDGEKYVMDFEDVAKVEDEEEDETPKKKKKPPVEEEEDEEDEDEEDSELEDEDDEDEDEDDTPRKKKRK